MSVNSLSLSTEAARRPGRPKLGRWFVNALTIGLCLLWALPLVWAIIVSLRPPNDPLGRGDIWFGETLTLESYRIANDLAPFFPRIENGQLTGSYYQNTLQYVITVLAVQLATIPLAAFAFVHFEFPGRKLLFYTILLQMMIPVAILLVPNFVTVRQMGLYDSTLGIAIPYFGSAYGVFLLRQAFLEVPKELVEAGEIDGARWYDLLWHVYLPPSRPTIIAFALVSVSFHWNSLLWPLVVTSDRARPLTMGLLRFTQLTDIGAQWSLIMAATLIIVTPLLLIFLIFQRQFIRSFMHSGIK